MGLALWSLPVRLFQVELWKYVNGLRFLGFGPRSHGCQDPPSTLIWEFIAPDSGYLGLNRGFLEGLGKQHKLANP